MSDGTHIEWTDATWNIITGCSVVSEGCKHCYAMKLAGTRLRNEPSRQGLTIGTKAGPVWNGQVRFNEKWLRQPLQWKRPRRIFVCAHGDLFHESVPDEWLDRVFAVMAMTKRHTFQVLTKRPERMAAYLSNRNARMMAWGFQAASILGSGEKARFLEPEWPLPNVWLGTSIENQKAADERIRYLLKCPAAVRWLSAEPLLGPISFHGRWCDDRPGVHENWLERINWVVVGGESGHGARPMHPDWARTLRDECAAVGTAFFFKQWGAWGPGCCIEADDDTEYKTEQYLNGEWSACSDDWMAEQDDEILYLLGKKKSGRLLDGREHSEYPA